MVRYIRKQDQVIIDKVTSMFCTKYSTYCQSIQTNHLLFMCVSTRYEHTTQLTQPETLGCYILRVQLCVVPQ